MSNWQPTITTIACWRDRANGIEIAALALTADHEGQAIAAPSREYQNFVADCKAWSRWDAYTHDSGGTQYLKMNGEIWRQWHEVYKMSATDRQRYELEPIAA